MKKSTQLLLIIVFIIIIAMTFFYFYDFILFPDEESEVIGGQRDEHGCLGPVGFTYDEEIQACIRTWELNNDQRQAAKIAVQNIQPYYSLTITEVETLRCPGCFIVNLTDKDFKQMQFNLDDWKIVEKDLSKQEKCENAGGTWKQFSNTCVDLCSYIRSTEPVICGQAFTDGCDCGPDKCWNFETETCEVNYLS